MANITEDHVSQMEKLRLREKRRPPQFDLSSFTGRLRHFVQITSVRNIFYTETDLKQAQRVLQRDLDGDGDDISNQEYYRAKRVHSALIHPDTGKKVPFAFRLSFFVPMNIVIAYGLLLPNASTTQTLFWQWFNQSYNVGVNHANRNASNELTNSDIAASYGLATGVSCGLAVGLQRVVRRIPPHLPRFAALAKAAVPFLAVASAGAANVYFMRMNEIRDGVTVTDMEGRELGQSAIAGRRAVNQTVVSRVCLSGMILVFPPLLMAGIRGAFSTPLRKGRAALACHVGVIAAVLTCALPIAVAAFPQEVVCPLSSLEPHLRERVRERSSDLTEEEIASQTVRFNRGL